MKPAVHGSKKQSPFNTLGSLRMSSATLSTLKNKTCHHELIALNLIVMFGSVVSFYTAIREKQ